MSLMGSVVTLYVLCWLLAASSSNSVSRNLNDTALTCAECKGSNGSTSQIDVTHSLLNTIDPDQQPHLNKSQNLFNQTEKDGKPSLNHKINGSFSQLNISFTQKPSTQHISPAAKSDDLTTGPEVTIAPLSVTNIPDLKETTAGVHSSATAAQAHMHTNASGTHLKTTTATYTNTTVATSFTSTASTRTPPTPTTSPSLAAQSTSAHASITDAPAPNISSPTTISKTTKQPVSAPTKPETPKPEMPNTTTTTAATSNSSSTTSTTAALSTESSSTAQYRSPVEKGAGQDLTRQLIDKASLLALLLFGLLFLFVVVAVFVTQAYESYRRKDYTQVDYLINGMYSDSGV